MKHYETMIIVPPTVSEKDLDNIVNTFSDDLKTRHNAKDVQVQKWGKKVLAYPIKKFTEGYYILCDYRSDSENTVSDFESRLRLSEGVLRFLTVRRDLEEKASTRLKEKLLKKTKKTSTKEGSSSEYENYNYEENDLD